jgi:hypothetical protein
MFLRRVVVVVVCLAGVSLQAQTDPGWWSSGVTRTGTANNYGPLTLGQLMNLADQARIHLDTEAGAVGGAGPEIEEMVAGWPDNPPSAYRPANLGQLKAIADKFYTRLDALGFDYKTQMVNDQQSAASRWYGTPSRPWNDTTPASTNYTIANIGQAKLLFSWDLTKGLLHAISTTMTMDEDTTGVITLGCLGAGTGPATYQILTNPSNGTAVLNGATVSYYPKTQYNGPDSFTFQATKGGQTNNGTISIVVNPVDDAPLVSVGGTRTVTLPGTLSLSATIDDIDTVASAITHNWIKVSGPGEVTFEDVGLPTVSGNVSTITTTASFNAAGNYVLRLLASDALSVRSDSLQVVVNAAGSTIPATSLSGISAPLTFGTPVVLQATVSVGGGATITKVEFYEGSRKIGEATVPVSGKYQLTWTPPRIGVYNLSAVATSSTGARGSTSGVLVARVQEGNWFVSGGAGNEGYSGTGGIGGASTGATTGPGGGYAPGSGANGGGGAAGAGGDGTGSTDLASKDSDGDGVSDAVDVYPHDPRRQKDVPVINYAVIDLSGGIQGDNDVENVAIGDDGQAAFSYWSSNTDYVIGKWKDGALVEPPRVTGSSRTDGDITKPTESKINSRGSVAFQDGSSWFYGTTGNFLPEFFGPVFALTESDYLFGNAGSEYALVPVGAPYDYSDHLDIKKSVGGSEITWSSITSVSASRSGNLLMSVNFEYLDPSPLGSSHVDNDLVFRYGNTNATIDSCDANAGLSFQVWSVNSYGQATYKLGPEGPNWLFSGGSKKNVETEKTQDYLLQTAEENQPVVLDNLLISRSGLNLEGPDLGTWVERQFLYDINPANADSNGKWPLSVAHFPDGWSNVKVSDEEGLSQSKIDIDDSNTDGVLIAKAYKTLDDTPEHKLIPQAQQRLHALMLMPCDISYISRDPYTGEYENLGGLLSETQPIPKVNVEATNVNLASNGTLTVDVKIDVRDALSEITQTNHLDNLTIYVNEEPYETVANLSGQASGGTVPVWQPYQSKVTLNRTITIPDAGPGPVNIRVQTGANAAGNVGWAGVAVTLAKHETATKTIPSNRQLSFSMSGTLSSLQVDHVTLSVDGLTGSILTETSASSDVFTGNVATANGTKVVALWLESAPPQGVLQSGQIRATLDIAGESDRIIGLWQGSGGNYSINTRYEWDEADRTKLYVAGTTPLDSSPDDYVEPFVIRLTVPTAVADRMIQPGSWLKVKLADQDVSLVEDGDGDFISGDSLAIGMRSLNKNSAQIESENSDPDDTPPAGMKYLYVASNDKPKLYTLVHELKGNTAPAKVFADEQFSMDLVSSNNDGIIYRGGAGVELQPTPQPPSGGTGMVGNYTQPEVLTWFRFFFGRYGENLLNGYASISGTITVEPLDNLWPGHWKRYRVENWMQSDANAGRAPVIRLDNDQKSAVQAAQALFFALNEYRSWLARYDFNQAVFDGALQDAVNGDADGADLYQAYHDASTAPIAQALGDCATAAEVGLSIANVGADIAFTLNDVATHAQAGEWKQAGTTLAMGAIFTAPVMKLAKRTGGKVIIHSLQKTFEISANVENAIIDIATATNRAEKMKRLLPLIVSGEIKPELIEWLYRNTKLLTEDRGQLRRAMGNPPNLHDVAHHYLPIFYSRSMELQFLKVGLDPNAREFGAWLDEGFHTKIHYRKVGGLDWGPGGPWNFQWTEFFTRFPEANETQVREFLDQLKAAISNPAMPVDKMPWPYRPKP